MRYSFEGIRAIFRPLLALKVSMSAWRCSVIGQWTTSKFGRALGMIDRYSNKPRNPRDDVVNWRSCENRLKSACLSKNASVTVVISWCIHRSESVTSPYDSRTGVRGRNGQCDVDRSASSTMERCRNRGNVISKGSCVEKKSLKTFLTYRCVRLSASREMILAACWNADVDISSSLRDMTGLGHVMDSWKSIFLTLRLRRWGNFPLSSTMRKSSMSLDLRTQATY